MMRPLFFLLILAFILSSSQSRSIIPGPRPRPLSSFKINTTQTVDRMIREMNDRFSEANSELLICITCLDPREKFSKFDIGKLVRLAKLYPGDFSRDDRLELNQQLQTFILDVRKNYAFLDINDLGSLV
ncbi:hypothetical protein OROMI_004070 [Orobanche minor]